MLVRYQWAYALVHGEAMVDTGWQSDQVPLVHGDADPAVTLVPDVKVGLAVQDVADLIVQVQVLLEEHLQLEGHRKTMRTSLNRSALDLSPDPRF